MFQRMKTGWLWLAAAALLVAGCTQPPTTQNTTGSVQLVAVIQAATADEVTRVLVTVTAPDMDPVTGSLAKSGSTWSGTLSSIPVGSNRTFTAEAFDATGKKLYAGQATGVTISADTTAVVNITLQETTPTPGFENDAPRITSLVASTNRVTTGGTVSLQVTAMDPNVGDTLSYAWTASAGSLDNPAGTATTWTAPALPGSATVTVTVTDSRGASAALSVTLTVDSADGVDGGVGGSASVGAVLNSWPQVSRITATPSFLAPGETTTVEALAADLDGDSLSYQWSSSWCSGTWTGDTSRTATFTPSEFSIPPMSSDGCGMCPLQVTVTDGRGGQTMGTLRVCVGTKPTPTFPPRFTSTTQSATTVTTGGTVTFRVTASDPMGGALSFQWSAFRGSLGAPVSGIASSDVVWTAPSCVLSTSPTTRISATAKNAAGLTTTTTFTVNLTGAACPQSTWVASQSLSTARANHTATQLSSGAVLVAGGQGSTSVLATAELYDPARDAWTATGRLVQARESHVAVALSSGKVLVMGGNDPSHSALASAELYDPATGTWSPAASAAWARAGHTAVVLASGKVLVVGGYGPSGNVYEAELYDPATNTWSSAGSISTGRYDPAALVMASGKVLVVGGISYSSNVADLYDPGTGTWSPLFMGMGHYIPIAVALPSGEVLVADTRGASFTAELYDPAMDTWTVTGNITANRQYAKAVMLASGKVLVMGGYDFGPSTGPVASAELYDPATGTWSSAGTMSVGRTGFMATVLSSGMVLVTGGWVPSTSPGSSVPGERVDLYLP